MVKTAPATTAADAPPVPVRMTFSSRLERRLYMRLEAEKDELETEKEELETRLSRLEHFENLEGNGFYPLWNIGMTAQIEGNWDSRFKSRYKRVKVLMVQWASDDLGVAAEIQQLAAVLMHCYQFDVSIFLLPDYLPMIALSARVMQFMDHDPETLLIFYYGGHGSIDPQRNETYWSS